MDEVVLIQFAAAVRDYGVCLGFEGSVGDLSLSEHCCGSVLGMTAET